MRTLFGFVVGYVVGARVGSRGFDEVVRSFDEIRRSPEFRGFVGALRHHAVGALANISRRLSASGRDSTTPAP